MTEPQHHVRHEWSWPTALGWTATAMVALFVYAAIGLMVLGVLGL